MTEDKKREEEITKIQAEKQVSEEEAKKEASRKSIEDVLNISATQAANETREILEVYDALKTQDPRKISKEKRDTDLKTVKNFQEKIGKNRTLAEDLVSAGLGSEQLSVTAGKLEERVNEVASEMEIHGEADSEKNEINNPDQEKAEQQNDLYPPPILPPQAKNPKNINDVLGEAHETGVNALVNNENSQWMPVAADAAKLAVDVAKGTQKIENAVADTAGNVAGVIAEKGAEEILGKGAVGKIGGKVAKTVTKDVVAAAVLSNFGGLGK